VIVGHDSRPSEGPSAKAHTNRPPIATKVVTRSKHDRKAEVLRHPIQVSHLRTNQMATDLGPSDPVLIGRATNHNYLGIGWRVFELRLLPTSLNPTSASC
jgi:hypothetical protein